MTKHTVALATLVLACQPAQKADSPLPLRTVISSTLELDGQRLTAPALTDSTWTLVWDSISTGDSVWLSIGARLSASTDAGNTESLIISFAEALPNNPEAVLRILTRSPASTTLTLSAVCGAPFIEPTTEQLRDYRSRARSALAAITADGLRDARDQCSAQLSKAIPDSAVG